MKALMLSQVFLVALLEYAEHAEASLRLPLHKVRNQVSPSSLRRRGITGANLTSEISGYLASISFGTPPQTFLLEIDTGSADLYILGGPGSTEFHSEASRTFQSLPNLGDFVGQYGVSAINTANGTYFSDTVTIGNATVTKQIAALVDTTSPDLPIGLIGIGYEDDESVVSTSIGAPYPNLISSLKTQGIISKKSYSIYLGSINSTSNSSILFDAIDSTRFTGPLTYLPTQLDPLTNKHQFLTVSLSSISLSQTGSGDLSHTSRNLPLPDNVPMNATLDTGTSQLQLPPSVALPVLDLVNAEYVATPFPHWTVACTLPPTVANSLLSFQFGTPSTTTPPLFPSTTVNPSLNARTRGITSTESNNTATAEGPNIQIRLSDLVLPATAFLPSSKVGDTNCIFGITNGTGGDSYGWIFGDPFLRSVYMVVNLDDNVVGLAQSKA